MNSNTIEIKPDATLNELFEILSHPTRRRILSTLATRNPRDEDEFQTETSSSDADDDLEQFLLQLTHLHLPKLADAEFINWDRETNTVTRGPRFKEIQPLIKLMQENQDELPDGWP
ncbi:helix-turn-helix transcriptional regulator [Natronolimnobius sp. AArcel1]|uniref:helix-turn-helix transcriptional regulator n=1 Tax=Natronolimnobius sp. AArcel1 TaxID=1679093 RepID=UPI0013EA132D|nr:helix-turn-helix transcriptional regulator [Natronolimnobius sp. AArcel1]NGM68569.1 helix-turn-helix transcriptional regulator [Natronolimnobius sp. AArcel1]